MAPPTDLLLRWLEDRLDPRLLLCLAFSVGGCALLLRLLAGHYGITLWIDLPFLAGLAFVALALLRLLDDLADRDYDRARHPQRLLTQPVGLEPFWAALALLAFAGLALTAGLVSPRAAAALLAVETAMVAVYALSRLGRWPRLLHAHAVLLKYPACVYCLAGLPALGTSGGLVLAGSYLLAAIGELGHDRELRSLPGGRALLLAEIALLAALGLWLLLVLWQAGP